MTDLFSSEQVRLRALEPEDLDFLYLWENDAELRESGNTLVPIGRNRLKEYIEKSSEGLMELGMMRLVICLSDDDKRIGAIDLYEYDAFHRRVAVGLFVIPEYRRLGIAVESLRKISHYVLDYYACIRSSPMCWKITSRVGCCSKLPASSIQPPSANGCGMPAIILMFCFISYGKDSSPCCPNRRAAPHSA